jgi:hypothetical protein
MGKPAMYEICGYHPFVKSQMSIQGQPGKDGKELFSWAKVSGDDLGVGSLKIHVKMYRGHGDYVKTYHSAPKMPHGEPATLKDRFPPVICKKRLTANTLHLSVQHTVSTHLQDLLGKLILLLEWIPALIFVVWRFWEESSRIRDFWFIQA